MNERGNNRIPLWQLAMACLYIGVTGYGGPAIVGHMKQVFIDRRKWLDEREFITGLSLAQLLPSATGVNTMEFLGYQISGRWGAVIAPVCFILPALVLMTILSAVYFKFGEVATVKALFTGLGAIVIALIVNATIILGRSAIKDWWAAGIAVAGFAVVELLHRPVPIVVLVSALLGLAVYRKSFCEENGSPDAATAHGSRTSWLSVGLALAIAAAVLALTYHSASTQLIVSMLRVGVLTFGGGFMAIPLFQHEAVTVHHWLTNRQFLDGIALGQITPGPVLITANFIGYRVMGVWGALIASLAIFAPGAIGMFIVVRQHERVKDLWWLQAIVRGIIAGFVGVLLTVAIRLGMQSVIDWRTGALAAVALAVLIVLKKDPLWVILGGAAVSLALFR